MRRQLLREKEVAELDKAFVVIEKVFAAMEKTFVNLEKAFAALECSNNVKF